LSDVGSARRRDRRRLSREQDYIGERSPSHFVVFSAMSAARHPGLIQIMSRIDGVDSLSTKGERRTKQRPALLAFLPPVRAFIRRWAALGTCWPNGR